jgi:FkbM family methyltransferase
MSLKGNTAELVARVAAGGPWRIGAERLARGLGHKYPTNRAVHSFCRHFGAQLLHQEANGFERVAVFESGGEMCCTNLDDLGHLALMYYFLGTITDQTEDERPIVSLFARVVRSGDVFFDIGANFGFYSFFVGALCGPTGEVHAFEANPLLRRHLLRSIEQNRSRASIRLNSVAVGRQNNTTLQLYAPDRIGCSSLYQHEWLDVSKSVSVPVITIDEYRRTQNIRRIDAVKIDIEGAELDAFHGMQETFDICPPSVIVCELMPLMNTHGATPVANLRRGSSADPVAIVEFLGARGFQPHYIGVDGRLGSVVRSEALQRLQQNVINVCFVRDAFAHARPDLFLPSNV